MLHFVHQFLNFSLCCLDWAGSIQLGAEAVNLWVAGTMSWKTLHGQVIIHHEVRHYKQPLSHISSHVFYDSDYSCFKTKISTFSCFPNRSAIFYLLFGEEYVACIPWDMVLHMQRAWFQQQLDEYFSVYFYLEVFVNGRILYIVFCLVLRSIV